MDPRIRDLAHEIQEKYGLRDYRLHRWEILRDIDDLGETEYRLSMEWHPHSVGQWNDETHNPEGTAYVEVDIRSGKLKRLIFSGGVTHADGPTFQRKEEIIRWIEKETGLSGGKQFQIRKEKDREFHFQSCADGVSVFPSGEIELKLDRDGRLVFFSVTGTFPSLHLVRPATFSLSLEQAEALARHQLKLIELPDMKRKRFVPLYGIEEVYITNDRAAVLPYYGIVDGRPRRRVDTVLSWEEPIPVPFHKKTLDWTERVTPAQAFQREPHPDLRPITEEETDRCIRAAHTFLRQVRADESGKWRLTTLHREKGYILADLQAEEERERLFQRKIRLFIDPQTYEAADYLDNASMSATYADFAAAEEIKVDKEDAFAQLRRFMTLTPRYVYDREQGCYVLCGKLDCDYAVNAHNGDVVRLRDV